MGIRSQWNKVWEYLTAKAEDKPFEELSQEELETYLKVGENVLTGINHYWPEEKGISSEFNLDSLIHEIRGENGRLLAEIKHKNLEIKSYSPLLCQALDLGSEIAEEHTGLFYFVTKA